MNKRFYYQFFVYTFLFFSSGATYAEDVVVLFRGIHKVRGSKLSDQFKETDARSHAALELDKRTTERLFYTLRDLYEQKDSLNIPPAASLIHGMAQKFVNGYYEFRNDIKRPESALYKELDQHSLDVVDHFFVSTSFSVESAMRFASGCLMGKDRNRTWPAESGETCVGWVDAFIIPQSHFMQLKPIVVNEGYALSEFNIYKPEFLKAQEILFLGYIPKNYHVARLSLSLRAARSNRQIYDQLTGKVTIINKIVDNWMEQRSYRRVFGSSVFTQCSGIRGCLTDAESEAMRGNILGHYNRLTRDCFVRERRSFTVPVEIPNFEFYHAIRKLSEGEYPVSLQLRFSMRSLKPELMQIFLRQNLVQSLQFEGDPLLKEVLADIGRGGSLKKTHDEPELPSKSKYALAQNGLKRLKNIYLKPNLEEFEVWTQLLTRRSKPLTIDISGLGLDKAYVSRLESMSNIRVIDTEKAETEAVFSRTYHSLPHRYDVDPEDFYDDIYGEIDGE